ncbi:hypothetical protein [Hyphomicrobium sp.]|uniref:hypothetical protein n=1 Tax=Hyphomicrobium sp. TaxID=82 RepID=UPI002D77997C|nr:hypothetical protein [Hyphomicrobium sp.]HET6390062.1 hypothetical protein [Hyphomicrobium sp.]
MRQISLSNTQRAIWMVLISSLAVPFFAGVIDLGLMLLSPLTDAVLPARGSGGAGEAAAGAFVWSVLPAAVAALGLTPFVLQRGTYSWLEAAVAGVLGFMAAVIIFPFEPPSGVPFLAFTAGLIMIGMRRC